MTDQGTKAEEGKEVTGFPERGSAEADPKSPFPVHRGKAGGTGRLAEVAQRTGQTTPAHVHGADGTQQCSLFPRAVLTAWATARVEKGPG